MTFLVTGPGRPDLKAAWQRDLKRHARRENGGRSFWRSMRVLGAVGWPIVLATAGGAMFGHWLDGRWHTGVRWTLVLLTLGVITGSLIAYRALEDVRR